MGEDKDHEKQVVFGTNAASELSIKFRGALLVWRETWTLHHYQIKPGQQFDKCGVWQ
jgi:hypothetical protein